MARSRITARKYLGDDRASWAVFIDGRPFVTGLTSAEVPHYKREAEACLTQREPFAVVGRMTVGRPGGEAIREAIEVAAAAERRAAERPSEGRPAGGEGEARPAPDRA